MPPDFIFLASIQASYLLYSPRSSGARLPRIGRRAPYVGPRFGVDEAPLAMGVAPTAHAVRRRARIHDHRPGNALHMLDLRQVAAGLLGARQRQPRFVASGN